MKKKSIAKKLFRPKKMNIMGAEWKIKWVKDLISKHNAYGITYFEQHLICIQVPTEKYKLTESFIEATYWHELVHVMLYNMNEEELNRDEKFVESMGLCLHQIIKTMK